MTFVVHNGDCREVMASMDAESVDAVVCDPPYGLSFMGKGWDHGVPGVEFWTEAMRVAKPGAHLLAFGGTRTFHRLACAIEDAGWDIRDCVMWVYGSGFPKSHDVSKAIDKAAGAEREVVGLSLHSANRTAGSWQHGDRKTGIAAGNEGNRVLTAPATDAARQWSGWGTALKPAWEPIIVARKPLCGTVAENVLAHGTGAINVDGCRVGDSVRLNRSSGTPGAGRMRACNQVDRGDGKTPDGRNLANLIAYAERSKKRNPQEVSGRWPANVIHDGSDEVVGLFPDRDGGAFPAKRGPQTIYGGGKGLPSTVGSPPHSMGDSGSAARFFYCAKASKADRGDDNGHPTVKPTALMRYLCRLVTPPGGVVLDPFTGSGSTGKAAILEGFDFVGIEREAEYVEIARARIAAAVPEMEPAA